MHAPHRPPLPGGENEVLRDSRVADSLLPPPFPPTMPKSTFPAQEAADILDDVLTVLEHETHKEPFTLPRQIVWFGGAPGSGKGTNSATMMRVLGITAPPIVCSDLLDTPEMKAIKDAGQLVGDKDVARLLLKTLLEPQYRHGVLVDGFPRSPIQGEMVRQLWSRSRELHRRRPERFDKADFMIVVLTVGEKESVDRQLKRGRESLAKAEALRAAGQPAPEIRATDIDEGKVRKRYQTFMDVTYNVLTSLKDAFPSHVIDGTGDIPTVEKLIVETLGRR